MIYRFVILLCIVSVSLWAQPEAIINRDDVPFLIGQWANFDQNADYFQWEPFDSMDLWWDLTVHPGGRSSRVHLLNPNQGIPPAPDTFPNAKIVELDTLGTGDVVWSYLSDTTFFFYVQGIDYETGGFRFIGRYRPQPYRCYAYPMYDGASWNSAWLWSYEVAPGIDYIANESHQKRIVARGKVKVPFSGEHFWPCLVIRDYMQYSDNFGTDVWHWIYEWVVPGRFAGGNGVAAAQSPDGANQNFMIVEHFFNLRDLYVPGWDLRCPDFANTTIWPDTSFLGPYLVSTEITDSTGIGADSLFYNVDGGQFNGIAHDSVNGDVYYYTIPAVTQSCTLGYFMFAEDSFSVANSVDIWNTDPICAPESTYYSFVVTTAASKELTQPQPGFNKIECFPNPFRIKTDITFCVEQSAKCVELKIYDATGRVVKDFAVPATPVSTVISWDGTDNTGKKVPNGIYFIGFKTNNTNLVEPVVLIR